MTDWRIVQPGDEAKPTLVEPERTYVLQPGDAHFYDVGVVHSPKREGLTKLVRIRRGQPRSHQTLEHQGSSLTATPFSLDMAPPANSD